MAKDDLNFNLDEFLASHSQGTKHMHSPKKKRASQSPTRTAAQQKAAEKKKKEALSKEAEIADVDISETSVTASPDTESAKIAENVAHQEADACESADKEAVIEQENREEIFIDAVKPQEYYEDSIAEEIAQEIPEPRNLHIESEPVENVEDTSEPEPITEAFPEPEQVVSEAEQVTSEPEQVTSEPEQVISEAEQVISEPEQVISEAEQIEEKSEPLDPEYFFRKDVKFDMPYLEPEPKSKPASSEPLPKYKDRTSEISFATKRRLSDTASVGVRRLREHEKSNAKIYTKPSENDNKPDEQELRLQEQLRRDRELTEKILRKAYEQEAMKVEFGVDSSIADTANKASSDSVEGQKRKRTKNKKSSRRKHLIDEEERTLPVVQVGTTDEDNSQSIIDVLENALDEDVIELEYVSKSHDETHSYETAPEKNKNKAQTFYIFIGLFFTVMSIIGIVVTAKSLVRFVSNVSDDSKQKQEFAEYIYPVVVADPAAFESVNDLSDEAIIKAAIWDIIIYDDVSKYTRDGSNNMYVPYIQVENHAKSLFGTTNIVHATVAFSQELTFFYDSENRTYKVPVSPQLFPNTPVVREIDKVGERYTLTVDYQEPTPNWELMNTDYTPGIKKTMEYVLTKYNDGYTIISINNVE